MHSGQWHDAGKGEISRELLVVAVVNKEILLILRLAGALTLKEMVWLMIMKIKEVKREVGLP